ncbi:MAG TPA: cytochrome d ubiquinol oxidase subunit II [Actinomycetota bacterium]|nr:cytochrome d ubiquinol oxidase subunit II [Actinomycetota bacterium]
MTFEAAVLGIVWIGLTLYVLLAGADFGGGVWDLFASRDRAQEQRGLISAAIGPVWEANHVWLIFVLTGLLSGFPSVFADLSVALYLPFSLALVGIVLRGSAFAFRSHGEPDSAWQRSWTRVFGIASLVSPFVLGAAAASIASGRIRVVGGDVRADLVSSWTSLLSLFAGLFAVTICAYLAATYLTVEAVQRGDTELERDFRARALLAGVIAGALAAAGLVVVHAEAPVLWEGMREAGLAFAVLSAIAGVASLTLMWIHRYPWARVAAIVAVASVLFGWGVAQWPYLIVPDVTVTDAAAPDATLRVVVVGFAIGGAVLAPSLYLLFRIFKLQR